MNDIVELKYEREKLEGKLKVKSVAVKKAFLFASHYSYLDKSSMRILVLISTFIAGMILASFVGFIGFLLPYAIWLVYDISRMDELVTKANEPIEKKLAEVNQLINNHMQVKGAIEHTIKFLDRFNKKAS